jgi:PPP family 3-phenylpropionic acid transporter
MGPSRPFSVPGWPGGLDAAQIGVLMGAGLLLRVGVLPLTGMIADARNDRRGIMVQLYALVFAGYAALNFVRAPELIFLAAILSYVASGAASPLLESVCMRLARHFGFDYGHVRLWASCLFVVGNLVSGVGVSFLGLGIIAPWLAVALFGNLIVAWLLPRPAKEATRNLSSGLRSTVSEAGELLRNKVFLVALISASLTQGSHAFYYAIGGLHMGRLGYSGTMIGILWPLGVLPEILFFIYSRKIFALVGAGKLLLIGAAASMLRWSIMALDPSLPMTVFAQLLHGATYALAHLGAMYFIAEAVPARLAATAQSLYAVFWSGLAMGLATLASGALYGSFGGQTYLLMAAMGVAAMIASLALMKMWHGKYLTRDAGPEIYDTI